MRPFVLSAILSLIGLSAVLAPAQQPTACEKTIARAFGDPGAYFSDPHDGDPIDLTVGLSALGNADPNDLTLGDAHLYASVSDPNARSSIYIPPGGKLIKIKAHKKDDPVYVGRFDNGDSYSIIQFPDLKLTLFVHHMINVALGEKLPDGRIKFGEMGEGGGGEWSYRTVDKAKKPPTVWSRSFHYHFELFAGLASSLDEAKERVPFVALCKYLETH
ncbi:MAG: hypothetical protein DYH05_01590 [Acidobacteria bacterium ACB1]|nr:hypothetical protein [Pyrinomonadaceae bacterium]MCE7961170.1 hypothetical protein [Acidobacteria bacterium ACB1]RIJ92551.1 MAG: hypothetical protein DCC44_08040 [Acidobacteriota bacterium]